MSAYEQAVEYLLDIPRFTKNKDNNNLRRILDKLGSPDRSFKIVHVAGTNGKGSVCAFMNSILCQAGYKVGLFTSPHLVKINERIRINSENISDEEFLSAYEKSKTAVEQIINEGGEHPSFFEYILLVALTAFANAKVEYVILEVGLGGRLDATNIIEKPIVSIISSVSKDHMEILGENISDIAKEKAGIIKTGTPVVYWGECAQVSEVMEAAAKECGTKAICVKKDCIKIESKTNKSIDFSLFKGYDMYECLSIPFVMEYQAWNASLVLCALAEVMPELEADTVRKGLMLTRWPGRMEEIAPRVYLDGAHNYDGVLQFKNYVGELVAEKNAGVYILFTVVKEKEYYQMMDLIEEIEGVKGYLVAPIMSARATAVNELAGYLKMSGKPVYTFESLEDAYNYGLELKGAEDYLFCVGSLYMVGEIKKLNDTEVRL